MNEISNDGLLISGYDPILKKRKIIELPLDTRTVLPKTPDNIPLFTTPVPMFTINHNYGVAVNPQKHREIVTPGSTITPNIFDNSAELTIDNQLFATSNLQIRRNLRQTLDQGYQTRSSIKFQASVPDSLQLFVVGNSTASWSFGDIGAFGIVNIYGGAQTIVKFTVTVGAAGAETAAVTLGPDAYNVPLTGSGGNTSFTAHEIENFTYPRWLVDHVGSDIFFISQELTPPPGVFTFASTGAATATTTIITSGVASTIDFIPREYWNGSSPMIQNLVPTYYNLYQIEWWLSTVIYSIFNPDTRLFEIVHTISNSNSSFNPESSTVYVQHFLASIGSTTPMTISTKATSGSHSGPIAERNAPSYNISAEKTLSAGVELVLAVINNRQQMNGIPNNGELGVVQLFISNDGNRATTISLILNPTTIGLDILTDYTNFSYVNETSSITLYDTTATKTYTGGTRIVTFNVGKNSSLFYNLSDNLDVFLIPGDFLVISALSSLASLVTISVIINEDI